MLEETSQSPEENEVTENVTESVEVETPVVEEPKAKKENKKKAKVEEKVEEADSDIEIEVPTKEEKKNKLTKVAEDYLLILVPNTLREPKTLEYIGLENTEREALLDSIGRLTDKEVGNLQYYYNEQVQTGEFYYPVGRQFITEYTGGEKESINEVITKYKDAFGAS